MSRSLRLTLVFAASLALSMLTAPTSAGAAGLVSDDFSSSQLGSHWSVVDPLADGTVRLSGSGTSNARLEMSVPAGTSHNAWDVNRSVRVMQSANDGDVGLEAKFDSVPAAKYQDQGLIVEQDANNWLRFSVYNDGSVLRAFAASTVNGKSKSRLSVAVSATSTMQLQVVRANSTWTLRFAADGGAFTELGSFGHSLTMSAVGPYVANHGSVGTSLEYTALVDYVFDTSAPVTPEDGGTPPVVSGVTVKAGAESATVSWQTDEPATGAVEFGTTTSYERGSVPQTTPSTSHRVRLTDLSPMTTYHYRITADDGFSNPTITADATFTTGSLRSDDLSSGQLGSLWTAVDPLGDGTVRLTGAGTADARLELSVPAGTSHNAWQVNGSVRVMQGVGDQDFGAEVKFDSVPAARFQDQGLIVEQDANNWLRFDVYHDGTALRAFAASTVNGTTSNRLLATVSATSTMRMQVLRVGSSWTLRFAPDGGAFNDLGTFSHSLTVSGIGPYVANHATSGQPPAYTALVDYVFNTAAPIEPEDGVAPPPDTTPPVVSGATAAAGVETATVSWQTDEPATGAVEFGTTLAYERGSVPQNTTATTHNVQLSGLSPETTYHYRITATDGSGNATTTHDATFSTRAAPTAGSGPDINVWYGDLQSFGADGVMQPSVNVLGNVSDPDGVSSLNVRVNGGASRELTLGPDQRRLEYAGDFNANIARDALATGDNSVTLTAVDGGGDTSSRTVTVRKVTGAVPSLPYTVEWSAAEPLTDQAQVVDGRWTVSNGALRTTEVGYDRIVALGDLSWTDFEVTVPITVHALGPRHGAYLSGPALAGLGVRWRGHDGSADPPWGFYATGAYAWHRWYSTPKTEIRGTDYSPSSAKAYTLNLGSPYMFKVRAETVTGGTRYSLRVWPQGTTEPSTWNNSIVEDAGPASGSIVLIAHHTDTTFGPVSVTPLAAP